jgi:hypothetical protein
VTAPLNPCLRCNGSGSESATPPLVLPADEFAAVKDLQARLEHAEAALAGDNEGCRLWMLDCGALVERWRQKCAQETERAERAEAKLAEVTGPGLVMVSRDDLDRMLNRLDRCDPPADRPPGAAVVHDRLSAAVEAGQ